MKYFLSQKQELIAHTVAKIPGMKAILNPVYTLYKNRLQRKRNENYQRYALEMIDQFDKCMTKYGYPYTLGFGSLLGAVREHGFIKHDLDMDVMMWRKDYDDQLMEHLKEFGFRLRHSFMVEGGRMGGEDCIVYKEVSMDIYYLYPPIEELPYCAGSWEKMEGSVNTVDSMRRFGRIKSKRIGLPYTKEGIVRVPFGNLMLPIPENADEILRFFYGSTYMIPNPNWDDNDALAKRIPWETENITYIEYEG